MEVFEYSKIDFPIRLNTDETEDADWLRQATRIAPKIGPMLRNCGILSPILLQGFDDLDDHELQRQIRQLLSRQVTPSELQELKQLVRFSSCAADFKRRRILRAFTDPSLLAIPIRVPVYTERDLLPLKHKDSVRPLDQSSKEWPTATQGKPVKDKLKEREAVAIKIGSIVREANLPAAEIFKHSIAPDRLLGRLAGGR